MIQILKITLGLCCQTSPHARHDTPGEAGTLCGPLEPTVTRMLIVRYYLCSSFKEGYGSGVDFLKNGNIRGIFAFLSWRWPFRNLIEAAELA
jgi:hypothetical protein